MYTNSVNSINISTYASQLQGLEKQRYIDKIKLFKDDPYNMQFDEQVLPQNVSSIEIYNYLVLKISYYTSSEFKAFKSLNSYQLYERSWVRYIGGKNTSIGFLVLGKDLHSQSLNIPPLCVWIHLSNCGAVVSAHCNCVAGLDECCTHIGAILFALNAVYKFVAENEPRWVTDVKAYWMVPLCKLAPQQCNENIIYNNRNSTAFNSIGDECQFSSREEMITILEKLKDNSKTPVAMLGLNAFFDDSNDIEIEYLLQAYLANLFEPRYEYQNLECLMNEFD